MKEYCCFFPPFDFIGMKLSYLPIEWVIREKEKGEGEKKGGK